MISTAETAAQAVNCLLERIEAASVIRRPTPHIVVEELLPDDVWRQLHDGYPPPDIAFRWRQPRARYGLVRYGIADSLEHEDDWQRLHPLWRAFWASLCGRKDELVDRLCRRFDVELAERYPKVLELPRRASLRLPADMAGCRLQQTTAFPFDLDGEFLWHKLAEPYVVPWLFLPMTRLFQAVWFVDAGSGALLLGADDEARFAASPNKLVLLLNLFETRYTLTRAASSDVWSSVAFSLSLPGRDLLRDDARLHNLSQRVSTSKISEFREL